MTIDVSVVIPVYNEERGLAQLFERVYASLDALNRPYEVIFVDDGSADRSVALLREQFAKRPDVTHVIILARNVGQHMAILAGFSRTARHLCGYPGFGSPESSRRDRTHPAGDGSGLRLRGHDPRPASGSLVA